jgi:hypothetical protein
MRWEARITVAARLGAVEGGRKEGAGLGHVGHALANRQ